MSDFKKIKKGEKLSFTNYVTVEKVNKKDGSIQVKDASGAQYVVKGESLIETFHSSKQFTKTEKLGKNALAEVLQNAGDKIFTVEYKKQDGKKRVLTGHFLSSEPNLGRSNVTDLEVTSGHNMRQVDHRTIKSIIVGGTKYVSK